MRRLMVVRNGTLSWWTYMHERRAKSKSKRHINFIATFFPLSSSLSLRSPSVCVSVYLSIWKCHLRDRLALNRFNIASFSCFHSVRETHDAFLPILPIRCRLSYSLLCIIKWSLLLPFYCELVDWAGVAAAAATSRIHVSIGRSSNTALAAAVATSTKTHCVDVISK